MGQGGGPGAALKRGKLEDPLKAPEILFIKLSGHPVNASQCRVGKICDFKNMFYFILGMK